MVARQPADLSLRPGRVETTRLAWALAISLALHAGGWGGYALGKHFHLWEKFHLPKWAQSLLQPLAKLVAKPPQPRGEEPPLMFVEVNPTVAVTEAPKDAKYYSSHNSQAANPDADADSNTPKISGSQEQVLRTETVPKNKFDRLMPTPRAEPAKQAEEESREKARLELGDLTLAKADPNKRDDNGQSDRPRPRTITEAKLRESASRTVREKSKQQGGVKRRALVATLDAKATAFGAYDAAFINAIDQRWQDLLDSREFASDRRGRVVVQFHLNYDGRITDMKVAENTVGEVLGLVCQKAVLDPAPFERWPADMRRMVERDFREIVFTFYYN